MYKLIFITMYALACSQEKPEFLNDTYPAHEYHDSDQKNIAVAKTVEQSHSSNNQNQVTIDSKIKKVTPMRKEVDFFGPSSNDEYQAQTLWAQTITEYALSYDYVNHKQHFYLMRPFFDQSGWHDLSGVVRDRFNNVEQKHQISKVTSTQPLTWIKHHHGDKFSLHQGSMPVMITFSPENITTYSNLHLSIKCNLMKKCLIHSLSVQNDKLQ